MKNFHFTSTSKLYRHAKEGICKTRKKKLALQSQMVYRKKKGLKIPQGRPLLQKRGY